MKAPDEIKKANECCASVTSDCNGCPYEEMPNFVCFKQKCLDTLAYIRQLETDACNWEIEATLFKSRVAQLESRITRCADCKHSAIDAYSNRRMCIRNGEIKPNGRIWFGVAVNDDHFCGYGEPPKEE